VLKVQRQARKTCAEFEAGEYEFIGRDDRETRERNMEGVMMKQGDPEQGNRKQNEINWHAKQLHSLPGQTDRRLCQQRRPKQMTGLSTIQTRYRFESF